VGKTGTQKNKAHDLNLEGQEEVRASIPTQNHRFNFIKYLVHRWTSLEQPREGEDLRRRNKMARGEMVWGQPSLIYGPITHSPFALGYFRANHLA
jgi:hypothetical protein